MFVDVVSLRKFSLLRHGFSILSTQEYLLGCKPVHFIQFPGYTSSALSSPETGAGRTHGPRGGKDDETLATYGVAAGGTRGQDGRQKTAHQTREAR